MTSVRVKICGLTTTDDALMAVDAGADLLGLIFVPNTPRCLSPERAQAITSAVRQKNGNSKRRPPLVGVFQNQPLDDMIAIANAVQLDVIQLHGAHEPTLVEDLPLPVIQFVPLQNELRSLPALDFRLAWLLEPPKGSGISLLDWLQASHSDTEQLPLLGDWAGKFPLLLAGGLTPDNISSLMEILASHNACPWAIDVASGVESSPGKKDPNAVREFCRIVHAFPSHFSGLNGSIAPVPVPTSSGD